MTSGSGRKRRIRLFGRVLCSWNIASLCVALFVLAGLFDDMVVLRVGVLVGLVVSAGTLLYRIYEDLREATQPVLGGRQLGEPPESSA